MASNGPGHLPSDRTGRDRLLLHTREPCLAPCRPPRSLATKLQAAPYPASSKAGRSRRPIPSSPGSPRGAPDGRQERCVSPTSATDSRHEHPSVCSIPESAAFRPSRHAPCGAPRDDLPVFAVRPRPWPRPDDPGGTSLDGEPPASASSRHPAVRVGSPSGRHPFLAGPRSTAPPDSASRPRRYRPQTEIMTWPLTPSVAPRLCPAKCTGCAERQTHFPRPPRQRRRLRRIRTPSIDENAARSPPLPEGPGG
jgi:hypothetical protein